MLISMAQADFYLLFNTYKSQSCDIIYLNLTAEKNQENNTLSALKYSLAQWFIKKVWWEEYKT